VDDLLANTVFTPIAFVRIVLGPWRRMRMRRMRRMRRKAPAGVFISI
jgi:hypothetical protein